MSEQQQTCSVTVFRAMDPVLLEVIPVTSYDIR